MLNQSKRLLQLLKSPGVLGISLDYVLFQDIRRPDPELGATLRIEPIANGNDDIQVKEVDLPNFPVGGNLLQFLHRLRFCLTRCK